MFVVCSGCVSASVVGAVRVSIEVFSHVAATKMAAASNTDARFASNLVMSGFSLLTLSGNVILPSTEDLSRTPESLSTS